MNIIVYIIGEFVMLFGFISSEILWVLLITAGLVIPFLFFKKTRKFKTGISLLCLSGGIVYGRFFCGLFFADFHLMELLHPKLIAYAIWICYIILFSFIPVLIFLILKKYKGWKHIFWLKPFILLYLGILLDRKLYLIYFN